MAIIATVIPTFLISYAIDERSWYILWYEKAHFVNNETYEYF